MKRMLQITNALAIVVTIAINYLSNTGMVNGVTIAELSGRYQTLITPAGYTFSIWGLIYLSLLAFAVFQGQSLFKKVKPGEDDFVFQIGWWFLISCLANSLWVIVWLYDQIWLSVLIMLVLLFSLLKIVVNTNMERWDAPLGTIVFVWWPFCLYAGWITAATIVNFAAYFTKIGWGGFGLGEETWTWIMLVVAGILYLFMIWSRNMREYALVGIWALTGIAVANWSEYNSIAFTALFVALILLVNVGIHGYRNKKTSPFLG